MKHLPPPGERGGQNRKGRRGGRGQRGGKGKRSPFSGMSRDLRARYERISQRDRKAGDVVAPGATGRIVTASVPSSAKDGETKYETVEAVEFDAADELAEPAVAAAKRNDADADEDEDGDLADDDAEAAEPVTDEEAEEELDDEADESDKAEMTVEPDDADDDKNADDSV